ncbi:MAG: serine hydrolase [Isosphaeraceae bacterium]|nr:serine hydrolase [Isosphaeraceae bacterium]
MSDAPECVGRGPIPPRVVVLAVLLLARVAPAAEPGGAGGRLVVEQGPDEITVTCRAEPRWKAVIDRTYGGVIRHFSLPDDGPNLIAEEPKTDGTVNPFRGMFNAFAMTRTDEGKDAEARIKAKTTLWGKSNGTARIRIVAQGEGEVVVEASGRAFGWRLLGPPDEPVIEYRQVYTFRPDRVACDGEITWIYPHGTRMEDMSVNTFFAPDVVFYPLRLSDDQGRSWDLPITSSKGVRLPEGVAYPANFDVFLKNGYRLRFRPTRLPEVLADSRWYSFERPWQQDWVQSLSIEGDTQLTEKRFPAGEPARYQYEMQIARLAPDQVPPRLTLSSPKREGAYRLGEEVRFAASAMDSQGRTLPDDAIEWAVYYPFNRLVLKHKGARLSHVVPTNPDELKGAYIFAVATATDSAGRKAQEYVKFNVDVHAPPAGSQVTFEWQTATPESRGLSSARLETLWKDLEARQTKGLLVIRDDRILFEKYAEGWGPARKHYTASMAKALVGGVATAVLLSDGWITLDDRVAASLPAWRADPRKAKITIRQLGSHTSGLDDADEEGVPHDKLSGWKGRFWRREPPPNDPFTIARDEVPVIFEPGTELRYSNPGIAMLSYALTYALTEAPQKDIRTLLRDRVMRPIGVPDEEWSVGYGQTVMLHGLPLVAAWGGGGYTPRVTARVARLMLREGDWEGLRLLKPEAVRQITHDAGTPGNGGIGWWTNSDGRYRSLPADAYFGAGAGDQVVLVIPSLKLIAVRNGGPLDPGSNEEKGLERRFFDLLMEAVTDRESGGPR